ncbi:MAG TPA: ATP-binding protein [Longimicrobium sp.]|nr:ATP-binding protein [Longimicrobium sp.]
MPDPPRNEVEIRGRPRFMGILALAFVLVSLAASLITPFVLQRGIDRIRAEVDEGADPARTLVTGIQFSLAREMSALRGYLITADTQFLATYVASAREEEEAQKRLEPLARGLGGEVVERFVVLRTLSARWHQEVATDEISRVRESSPEALARIPMEQELYEDALTAARDLDDAIVRATRGRAREIREVERRRLVLTGGLVFLAFVSSLVVAWLGRQVSRLALEAERQRVKAVRALAESHRTLASRYRLMRGVTHDIKNPLGAADGYGELLLMGLHGRLGAQQEHAVTRIRGCIADALAIIHDLLELSRAESGSLPVEKRETELGALLRGVADEYRAAAGGAGRAIEVEVAEPASAFTDPARVRQILGNLVSNAIKYARGSDRVVLSAGRAPAGSRRGAWMVVRVTDFGPGIPAGELANLFEEFYRADDGAGVEGHGLGLSIAQRIARLLGGDLTAESEVGRGSVFTLWIPLEAAAAPPVPAQRGADVASHATPA